MDRIARGLGVTEAGLRVLARAVADPDGDAWGPGFGVAAAGARQKLGRQGYIDDDRRITDAGREIVCRARALGW